MLRESDNSMMVIGPGGRLGSETLARPPVAMPSLLATAEQRMGSDVSIDAEAVRNALSVGADDHHWSWQSDTSGENPTSVILGSEHWRLLERGLRQRFEAVNACLSEIVRRRFVPGYLDDSAFMQEKIATALGPILGTNTNDLAWAWLGSTDVHLSRNGRLTVLDHNFSLPNGFDAFATLEAATLSLSPFLSALNLRDSDGVTVVLMPGHYSVTGRENEFLARRLNAHVATAADINIQADGVFLHTGRDRVRVSTIVRRIDDDLLDPNCFRPDSLVGVPGLVRAWRNGLVNVLNPPGSCVANCRTFGRLIPRMIREYLGEQPLLDSAPVLECEDPKVLKHVLANLNDYAIRTNDPLHPARPFFGRAGRAVEFADLLTRIRKKPAAYVARPLLQVAPEEGINLRLFASRKGSFQLARLGIARRCQLDGGAALTIGSGQEIFPVI